jgi:hypothetical protein
MENIGNIRMFIFEAPLGLLFELAIYSKGMAVPIGTAIVGYMS